MPENLKKFLHKRGLLKDEPKKGESSKVISNGRIDEKTKGQMIAKMHKKGK